MLLSSDKLQYLKIFLRLHVIKYVQEVIEAMLLSSASGCASALVDLQQQLANSTEWIYRWINPCSIVNEAFEKVLQDYPDFCNAVNAQVSVLCQLYKWLMMVILLDIIRQMKIRRVVIVVIFHSHSSIVYDHYHNATSHTFYSCYLDVHNSYKPLMVSGTECVGIEVMLKYFAEDKGNKNNWSTQVHIWNGHIFSCPGLLILWICNLSGCRNSLIFISPRLGLSKIGITRPSTYFIYQKLYRLHSSIVLLTCSPIRDHNLVWKGSCHAGHVMRNPLTWYPYMHSFCSGSSLIFHSRCQQHLPWSGKNKNIWICPTSTSVSTSNISSTQTQTSMAVTILSPAVTSGASDGTDG